MRNNQLITSYIQAVLFGALGLRAIGRWLRDRDRRSADLALATALFGLNSLISAISQTLYDQAKGEMQPRALAIISSIVLFTSLFFFLRFLSDFVPFPSWLHWLSLLVTLSFIVLSIIERPDIRVDPRVGIVKIPGIDNPIPYLTYVGYVLVYLAVVFAALGVTFMVFGLRVRGLPRFRMVTIAAGFLLLFIAVGLLPRLLFGDPSSKTISTLTNVVRYIALVAAPLLLIGFVPPRFITRSFDSQSIAGT